MSVSKFLYKAKYMTATAAMVFAVAAAPVAVFAAPSDKALDKANGNAKGHSKTQELPEVPASDNANENATNATEKSTPNNNAAQNTNTKVNSQTQTKTNVPKGNNGTLKVHEFGTPRATVNNDPKVCIFNFEGFGFDVGQSGYIMVTGQGQSKGKSYGPFDFGPTVEADKHRSFAETVYFNQDGGVQIANGHYKATLYGKQTGGSVDYKDVKAKSKVFKVKCDAKPVTPVDEKPEKPEKPGETLGTSTAKGGAATSLPKTGSNIAAMIVIASFVAGAATLLSMVSKSVFAKLS